MKFFVYHTVPKNPERVSPIGFFLHWKHQKKLICLSEKLITFEKVFGKKKSSYNAEKHKNRPFTLIKRFLHTDNFTKIQGVPFDRIQNFSEKNHIVPKKIRRGDPSVYYLLLEILKNSRFSARLEPTLSCF